MVKTVVCIRSQRKSSQDRAQEENQVFAGVKNQAGGGGRDDTLFL